MLSMVSYIYIFCQQFVTPTNTANSHTYCINCQSYIHIRSIVHVSSVNMKPLIYILSTVSHTHIYKYCQQSFANHTYILGQQSIVHIYSVNMKYRIYNLSTVSNTYFVTSQSHILSIVSDTYIFICISCQSHIHTLS